MTYIRVKVPSGTDISGYDAEFKRPQRGDEILTRVGIETAVRTWSSAQIVLTPKWNPPEWLKPGWIAKNDAGWMWFSSKPEWSEAHRWWYQMSDAERSINLSLTNFRGPDMEPKDSLIEIRGE